jgi:glycosyltransferase involved in cell wall biosynthesis
MPTGPRILIVSGDYPPTLSGIADYSQLLARHLHARGADVSVLTSAGDALEPEPFEVHRLMQPGWPLRQRKQLVDLCQRFDVINLQYPSVRYQRGLLINALPALLHLRKPTARVVTSMHDFRVMSLQYRLRTLPMLWSSDGILYVSESEWPLIEKHLLNKRVMSRHVPIASNVEPVEFSPAQRLALRSQLGFAPEDIIVAFFGILYPHKGLGELTQAIAGLRASGLPVKLLAIADFDRAADYVEPITKQLSQPWVTWIRGQRGAAVSPYLHAADLACTPDHFGAATNRSSMLAGLAHGLPTVAVNGTATPSNIRSFFDLELVPARNAHAIQTALDQLIHDESRRRQMRTNAVNDYAKFSWTTAATKHAEFFDQVLGRQQIKLPAARLRVSH